ncbi:MAG: hypothetical protein EBU42_04640, partial [Synechococcus sp.]|nr:hypothetical protein [Synechococcus sp.]
MTEQLAPLREQLLRPLRMGRVAVAMEADALTLLAYQTIGGQLQLQSWQQAPLPSGVVEAGVPLLTEALGDLIGDVLLQGGLQAPGARALLPPEADPKGQGLMWTDEREDEGELLWPERFGEEEVAELEKTLGPYGAAGQLQQRPQPAGGGIVKRGWWMPYDKPVYPDMSINIGSVDLAFTSKKENDFSAMTCWGVWRDSGETTALSVRDMSGQIIREVKSEKD